jgi:hypothetical protein
MERLYCLFTITQNTYYTTIQGCDPVTDRALLENIRGWIALIRKPSPSIAIEVLETNGSCVLTDAGRAALIEIRKQLE